MPVNLNRRDALQVWHKVNMATVLSKHPNLSPRQMALLTCLFVETEQQTIRSLAANLNVTKSIITQILKTLGGYGYIERVPDLKDRRSVVIQCTEKGISYLMGLAELICLEINSPS